jgi:TolB-like protein/DNA-binding winged helix-turn-helix (wHTH) protein/tetratricopeptide (TPR) repeat protein
VGVLTVRATKTELLQFGAFELDLTSGELRKAGAHVKLPPQPCKVLGLLASRPGELVTRKEIQQQIWEGETFVDFEEGLNFCIKQIRTALGDHAQTPRYIETLPRRGYRFIYPVEGVSTPVAAGGLSLTFRRRWVLALLLVGVPGLLVALLALNVAGLRERLFGPAPKPITSIAVLPLENLSGDPEQEYFVDGMTEALTTELSKISALRVISRQSAMQYKGTDKLLPQIARELGVDAVVEGSALREGDTVRISVQFIRATPERHLWAQSYERDLSGILIVQSEVARAVADEVKVRLTPQEQARLASARPINREAYEAYLKGRYHYEQWSGKTLQLARDYYQQAIQLDPNYPLPYVGLAESYIWWPIYMSPHEAMANARPLVKKALELDNTLGEAHAALAAIKFRNEWDWLGADAEFRRALQLNPNYAEAHHMYSHLLLALGRNEDSLTESQRALALDPRSPAMTTHMGTHYIATRQYDLAIEQFHRAFTLDPNFPEAHYQLGWALAGKGMYQEAIAELKTAVTLREEDVDIALLGYAYARSGSTSEAQEQLRELKERAKTRYVRSYNLALVYVGLGQNGQAFQWLEKAFEERDVLLDELRWDYVWDGLRDDPRFQSLLRHMNFPT